MKDANGFHIDVAGIPDLHRDLTLIRMNVDDFEEAYAYLLSKGFAQGGIHKKVDAGLKCF